MISTNSVLPTRLASPPQAPAPWTEEVARGQEVADAKTFTVTSPSVLGLVSWMLSLGRGHLELLCPQL